MNLLKGISIATLLIVALIGCKDIKDCQLKDDTSFFVIALFDRDTTSSTESIAFTSIIEESLNGAFYLDTTMSVFGLPVNTTDTTTTYFFQSELGADTLVVSYDFQYNIFFEDCEPVQSFFDLSVLSHTFDSLVIVNENLNNEIIRNVEIYLD
ncbi:MAG: DUF6452 family protein [Bacteroidota bacterium]